MYVTNIWGCAFFFGGIGACFGALGVVTLLAAFARRERFQSTHPCRERRARRDGHPKRAQEQ